MSNPCRIPIAAFAAVGLVVGFAPTAWAQTGPAGPVVVKNASDAELTITNLRYVDSLGATQTLTGEWKLKPGFYGYLKFGPTQDKIVARKITYDLVTADGKTVNWSCESIRLDADGDFSSQFTSENLASHQKLLGKVPVVALKPAPAGPSEEDVARGVLKALGAAVLHQKAKQVPKDFGEAFVIELARTGRDELIKSAVDDLFPQIAAGDRATLGRLVPLALDGRLTAANLRAAESRDAIANYLKKQNPDFALAAQAADFLYRVQQGSR